MRNLKGNKLNCVAFPLGGIGTGNISLAGDGSLRQWQIVNNVNHQGFIPSSFFFIQIKSQESENWDIKLLEKDIRLPDDYKPAETSNDHIIPKDILERHEKYKCIQNIEFRGEYPFAKIIYSDEDIPVNIELEAWNPMIPLDIKNSSLPVIIFNFKIINPNKEKSVKFRLGGTFVNLIGWDGITQINFDFYPNFYRNVNREISTEVSNVPIKGIRMISGNPTLDEMHKGKLIFASKNKESIVIPAISSFSNLLELLNDSNYEKKIDSQSEPSQHGKTWLGAILNEIELAPLEEKDITLLLGWSFPNRYQNWDKHLYKRARVDKNSKFWLGNRYNRWWKNVTKVIEYTIENYEMLEKSTRDFHDLLFNTTLPKDIIDSISATMSIIRSPSCFITKRGEFMGFEGCCGASTAHHTDAFGGCCPMNCTHVWNYAVTHARLYPTLEMSMLDNEFKRISPKGRLPHRLIVPTYLPQLKDNRIGGPERAAIDGLFGCILKTYRILLYTNDFDWFKKAYPNIRRLMKSIFEECDPDGQGVIEGEQPNTYDISFYGKNLFIGLLYLAALKAFKHMADLLYDEDLKEKCSIRFSNGIKNYDESLWNGEYWIQAYNEKRYKSSQYGTGCLTDQLFGQFWGSMLELGLIMPEEKITKTLDSIMKYNFKESFKGIDQKPRIFASEWDKGLLMCSWPQGDEPKIPFPYAHEVWTGTEYEIAALMIDHGKTENALNILEAIRGRYDGVYRNPWNEVECGDHYIRAMSSWRVYESAIGFHWNAIEKCMDFLPRFEKNPMQAFYITNTSWGLIKREFNENEQIIHIIPKYGILELIQLSTWDCGDGGCLNVEILNRGDLKDNVSITSLQKRITIRFKEAVQIKTDEKFCIKLKY